MRTVAARRRGSVAEPATPPSVIRYCGLAAPIGRIWLGVSDRGVVRISLGGLEESDFVAELAHLRPGARLVKDATSRIIAAARRELLEYFSGTRTTFTLPVDLDGLTAFQRKVLGSTGRIPLGRVATYGRIAEAVGRPGGARAVGGALRINPVPIVIPCHRVVASGGGLGGFTVRGCPDSLDIKRKLLALEGQAGR
jgi:methylated-DNA-[protein]-cysteine S-methyltransferase